MQSEHHSANLNQDVRDMCDHLDDKDPVQKDRRDPATKRKKFDGIVEFASARSEVETGQAIDISITGMRLRTHFVPDVGESLSCRFDCGVSSVIGEGDVTWRRDLPHGSEFGLKFTSLDAESEEALRSLFHTQTLRMARGNEPEAHLSHQPSSELHMQAGSDVRLHVSGLEKPLRATVKWRDSNMITAASDLEFLRIGKMCELESKDKVERKSGTIEGVEVSVDPLTQVPELVISVQARSDGSNVKGETSLDQGAHWVKGAEKNDKVDKVNQKFDEKWPEEVEQKEAYLDGELHADSGVPKTQKDTDLRAKYGSRHDEAESSGSPERLSNWVDFVASPAANMAQKAKPSFNFVASALKSLGTKAKHAIFAKDEAEPEYVQGQKVKKRVTAPAPYGGLYTSGKHIIRKEEFISSESSKKGTEAHSDSEKKQIRYAVAVAFAKKNKRKLALGGAIGVASLLGLLFFGRTSNTADNMLANVDQQGQGGLNDLVSQVGNQEPKGVNSSENSETSGVKPGDSLAPRSQEFRTPTEVAPAALHGLSDSSMMKEKGMSTGSLSAANSASGQGQGGLSPEAKLDVAMQENKGLYKDNKDKDMEPAESLELPSSHSKEPSHLVAKHKRPSFVRPFGHGDVRGGKTMGLRMDNFIQKLQGASTPMGFTVVLPHVKALDGAASFAKRDPRVESAHVDNGPYGAELTVNFKDGVPPYLVRAEGDVLQVVLGNEQKSASEGPKLANMSSKPTKAKSLSKSSKAENERKDGRVGRAWLNSTGRRLSVEKASSHSTRQEQR